jgi:hypothetical protein
MMKTQAAAPPPKDDSSRKAPAQTKDRDERPALEGDDRWAKMPCTD